MLWLEFTGKTFVKTKGLIIFYQKIPKYDPPGKFEKLS